MGSEEIVRKIEDRHKYTVNEYFSDTALYWKNLYDESDRNALSYDNYSMIKRKNTVFTFLDTYAGKRHLEVLDAGCGPGVVLDEVCMRGHNGTGIDVSDTMVEEANRRLDKYVKGKTLCQTGDIEALPYDQGSFDVVMSLGVLMYLPSDHKALLEISRVVKSGGIVLLVLPNLVRINMLFDPYYIYRAAMYGLHLLPKVRMARNESLVSQDIRTNKSFTNRRYLYTRLNRLFEGYGFKDIRICGTDYSPMTIGGRHIFSTDTNIAISEKTARIAGKNGFGWLHALANQWVICLTRI